MAKHFKLLDPQQRGPSTSVTSINQTHWNLCVLCQMDTTEPLHCPADSKRSTGGSGYQTLADNLLRFSEIDCLPKSLDMSRLDDGEGIESTFQHHRAKWHDSCRLQYNKTQLIRAEKRKTTSGDTEGVTRKYTRQSVDRTESLLETCFFCDKPAGNESLRKASTFDLDRRVRKCALKLEDSLKADTRKKRGKGIRRRVEPSSSIPGNWQTFLRTDENKMELFDFLATRVATTDTDKQVISTHHKDVVCTQARDVAGLAPCSHEEADTRMLLHAEDAVRQGYSKVSIRTVDTDVVVLAVTAAGRLDIDELWVAFGTGKNFRFLAAHEMSVALGPNKCRGLPFFHALTGCDTVSSFGGRGKKKAWETWKACDEVTDVTAAFCALAATPTPSAVDDHMDALERFVVVLYDRTSSQEHVNECRKHLFTQNGRSIDALPPTREALKQHIKRATYQAGYCWGQMMVSTPELPSPSDWGWVHTDNGWDIYWTTLPEATEACRQLLSVWHYGILCTYGCGGYIHPLSSTRSESQSILSELERNNWIDDWTRAVFVEYVQWVPAVGLHSVVTVLVEFPPVGGAVQNLRVWPFLLHRFDEPDISLVLMGCLLAFVPLLVVSEVMKAQRQGWDYVRGPWHVMQWLILVLSVCSPTIHLYRRVIALQVSRSFPLDSNSFLDLYPIAFLESIEKDVTAFLLFLILLRILQQIKFVRAYAVISNTFQQAYQKLLIAFITFLVLLLAFIQLGYLLYNSRVSAFHSLGKALISLGSSLLGCWFTSFADLDRGIAKMDTGMLAYVSCAAVTLHWLFVCLFAAILLSSYRVACNEVQGNGSKPQAYEMMEFCMKRVKLTLGLIKPKEFRHSVKFEGMESLPSHSSYSRKSPLQISQSLENIIGHYPNKTSALSSLFASSMKSEPRVATDLEGSPEVVGFLPCISHLTLAAERMLMATEHLIQATVSLLELESQLLELLQENWEGDELTRKSHLGRVLLPQPTQNEGIPIMANALETKSRYKRPKAVTVLNMLRKPKETALSSERTFGVRSALLEQRVPGTERQNQRGQLGKEIAQVERKQKE